MLVAAEMTWYDAVGFHAQQGAEKALKAVLVRHQVSFRHTHEIGKLLAAAEPVAPGIGTQLVAAEGLSSSAVAGRYPGPEPPLSRDEASRQLELARAVMTHVRGILKPYLDAGPPAG